MRTMVNLKESNFKSMSNSTSSLNSIEIYANKENDRTVYLGDLELDMDEKQLHQFFASKNYPVVKIVKQPHSSFAHVTFDEQAVAKSLLENAILKISNKIIRVMPFNQPNNFDPNANLIIKNLESYVNETNIIQKFKQFGDILSCKLVRDENGDTKCYAFLQFKDKASALDAIDTYNNTYWDPRCDPDYKFKKFKELVFLKNTQQLGKLNEADFQENELFADFSNKMGKKIYVGIFKKKDEYSKIKSDKEGKQSNLYVKNFGTDFGDRDLFNLFKEFGSIKSAKVRRMKVGLIEKPLGCGFVDFENPEEAEKARLALDNFRLPSINKVISVTYADCKSRRMRKKLEEGESKMSPSKETSITKSIHDSLNTRNDTTTITSQHHKQQQQQHSVNQPQRQEYLTNVVIDDVKAINENNTTVVIAIPSFNLDQKNRKSSTSSESSNHSLSSSSLSSSYGFAKSEWPDIWSKLLNTCEWDEYKLFP